MKSSAYGSPIPLVFVG